MFGWTEEQQAFKEAVRRFVEAEIAPRRRELEFGELRPYGVIRQFYGAFGIGDAALERFHRSLEIEAGEAIRDDEPARSAAETLIPIIEIARYCPGIVTAMGVSTGLTAGAILRAGDRTQRERWAPKLLTFEHVGAWAITEPDSGSDAFGSMRSSARPDGEGWILNGSKTFITNGPDADTIVFICKVNDGTAKELPEIATFVLDRGMEGLEQSGSLQKMGMHSSPTGELAVHDLRVGRDRRLQSTRTSGSSNARAGARATFATERASLAAMALGIIERALELSTGYALQREQFGRPIAEFQLIQLKLAQMEVARLNVENLVLRYCMMADAGRRPTLAEASAMKLYAAQSAMQVTLEAVQVFGGNGYMAENHVEQLCRDAKVLQIYAGTDEIQITHIAKDLYRRHRSNPA